MTDFKGAKFIVCVEDLDSIITKEPSITIKKEYNCYCYIPKFNMYPPRPTEYFTICGTNITNRYVIKELIKQRFNPKCNHKFLEQINLCDDGVTWDMFLGS